MRTINNILDTVSDDYLDNINMSAIPDCKQIEEDLIDCFINEFQLENGLKEKGAKYALPKCLPDFIIAKILIKLHNVKRLVWAGSEKDGNYDVVVYQSDGDNEGIYVSNKAALTRLIKLYNKNISARDIDNIISILSVDAPLCFRNTNPDLIAVHNGIFDYSTKKLLAFTPDIVFTSKSGVDYKKRVKNHVIHNPDDNTDWDVESWMNDLSDDPEIVDLLWQVLGAIIRPHVRWNKVVCLYSEQGNNGKGTLCQLMRNLCGNGNHASIPFNNFGQDFMLQQLTSVSAVITDENDVKSFATAASALKAIITGDYFTINRKFLSPITIQFSGLMIQCTNDLPRFSDKSESLYRRFLMIPFNKCFTGHERKYIKADYLNRQDVLEYVLHKVLNTNFYEFSEPDACKSLLGKYKAFNDPVRQFLDEMLPECVWDLLPYQFLYDLYKAWFKKNVPSGQVQGSTTFIKDVQNTLYNNPDWKISTNAIPPRHKMDKPEPLIADYELNDWKNSWYRGSDINRMCTVQLKSSYKGLLRIGTTATGDEDDTEN